MTTTDKLEAHFENRIYYFYLKQYEPTEIRIEMYSTPYTFIQKETRWVNHTNNKMNMAQPLINEVVKVIANL